MWQNFKKSEWPYVLVFILFFVFAFRKLWFTGMLAYGDSPPFPESWREAFVRFFYAWHPLSQGLDQPQPLTELYRGILLFLTFNRGVFAQHLFYFSPFLIAFITSFLFLGPFVKSNLAKFLAAFFYAVNPASIGAFIGGASGMLYVHALFPWLAQTLWYLSKPGQRLTKFLFYALAFTLTMSFGGYVPFLVLPIALFLLFLKLLRKEFKDIFIYVGLSVLGVAVAFILQLPFYAYSLPLLAKFFITAGSGGIPLDVNALTRDILATYGQNQLINLGLGGTYANLQYLNWAFPYSFLVVIIAFSSLFLITPKNKTLILTFAIGSLLLVLFLYLTHLGKTIGLFRLMPNLLLFRSPAKLGLLLAFGYLPLIALSAEWLIEKFKAKALVQRLMAIVSLIFFISVLAIQGFPFFTGDMTFSFSKRSFSSYIIPHSYYEIAGWVKEQRKIEPYFRTQWFPWTYEGQELKIRWLDSQTFNLPLGFESFSYTGIKDYTNLVLDKETSEAQTSHFGKWLGYANIKYLILNRSLKRGFTDSGENPLVFLAFWEKQKDLLMIKNEKNFFAFENKEYVPLIFSYSQIYLIKDNPEKKDKNYPLEVLKKVSSFATFSPKEEQLVFEEQLNQTQKQILLSLAQTKSVEGNKLGTEDFRAAISPPKTLVSQKLSPTHYRLTIETDSPQFIVLGEPYSPLWQANLGDKELFHFNVFYRNGFYLEQPGKYTIDINYLGQQKLNLLLIVWLGSWLVLALGFWYGYRLRKKL